jgi:hypothetical protein
VSIYFCPGWELPRPLLAQRSFAVLPASEIS